MHYCLAATTDRCRPLCCPFGSLNARGFAVTAARLSPLAALFLVHFPDCHPTDGCALFRAFLSREYSEENIEFWIACEEYRKARSSKFHHKARKIFDNFLDLQAPKEVCCELCCAIVPFACGVESVPCARLASTCSIIDIAAPSICLPTQH